MGPRPGVATVAGLTAALACAPALRGAGVRVIEAFPSDAFTAADPGQKTGLRVNLPFPDCGREPATCEELGLVNQYDGFSIQPRIRVRFSGAVNPDTLRAGIHIRWLENLTTEEFGLHPAGHITPINQVLWDPVTNTAYAKPDQILAQHRRYALVVTGAVRDRAGDPVEGTLAVFTTMSTTAWLEKARAAIQESGLNARPTGTRSVFRVADIAAITLRRELRAGEFDEFTVPAPELVLNGIDRIAFGSYFSPDFLNERRVIAPAPTGAAVGLPAGQNEVYYHAFLPEQRKPAGGYPVVIFGHGLNDSRFGGPTLVAGTLARAGFATLAINAAGHGSGPGTHVRILEKNGARTDVPAPGRGLDLNGDGAYGSSEGCLLPPPVALLDCLRQTALDLMQLVRAIRVGLDLDGDGLPDLDAGRIYYAGQSLGALYGTIFVAVEPDVRAAVFNVGGGSVVEIARWSPGYREIAVGFLADRRPPLLNRPGDFAEDYVLRYRPVEMLDTPGAVEIQELFERLEWLQLPGDPLAYAPHLVSSTLPGVPIKRVLWQMARGDRSVPNPASTNLIRAANMRNRTLLYRHDLARAAAHELPENPHAYLVDTRSPAGLVIALAAQQQMADFLAADGAEMPGPFGPLLLLFRRDLFEVPEFLTEDLGFDR